ncbi:hypothetical protein [Nocardiopsis sp. NPDC058789]|uniref:hypothetical protein n=1 Tax=Nocardiopsis sp. NPDC058789 TaxID=3346634 RepID=UPI00366B0F69
MSESSTETSAVEAAVVADPLAETSAQNQEASERDDQEQGIDWKAKSREWEKRAKANAGAAKRLEEIEDAKKSEVERATGKQQRAEKERDDAVAKLLRYEVATAAGLPLSVAHRLQGATAEELEADARELVKLLADKKEAERKENLVDPSAGRGSSAGSSTAEQFAAMFSK